MNDAPADLKKAPAALNEAPAALNKVRAYLAAAIARPPPPAAQELAAALRDRYPGRIKAILLYGSTLREPDFADAVVDLYALVDNYRGLCDNAILERLNRLLPPNVFYLQTDAGGTPLRCKYALISLSQFARGCRDWFHSYLWGRFCQPSRLLFAADDETRRIVARALADSVLRLLRETCVFTPATRVAPLRLWSRGLSLSYGAELRPEGSGRAEALVASDGGYYRDLLRLALPLLRECYAPCGETTANGTARVTADAALVRKTRRRWRRRRLAGKGLSVLRLFKAAFTFRDAVDYAAWKIHRHTGERIELTPRLRRHPALFGWRVLCRLLRRKILK